MYSCPACNNPDVSGRSSCVCGADLSLLRSLDALPDLWFNEALDSIAENRPGRAIEWLAACCAVRPTDAAALRLLAKTWILLDRWREASDALDRAVALDPDAPEVPRLRESIMALRKQRLKSRSLARRRRGSARVPSFATRPSGRVVPELPRRVAVRWRLAETKNWSRLSKGE